VKFQSSFSLWMKDCYLYTLNRLDLYNVLFVFIAINGLLYLGGYMRQINVDWFRLFRYSLLFIAFSAVVTLVMLLYFSTSLDEAWRKGLMLTLEELEISFELSLTLFIYISFPLLLFRFMYYFSKMLYRGRREGVAMFTYKTLFNPINFLLFPSLLNPNGLLYRTRCILSLLLLVLIYFVILLIT
ncbi:MAG: hypothetical protein ACI8SJ_001372, partial [Shewanella sp.]